VQIKKHQAIIGKTRGKTIIPKTVVSLTIGIIAGVIMASA